MTAQSSVIPAPQSVLKQAGVFPISERLVLSAPDDPVARENARYFAGLIADTAGQRISIDEAAGGEPDISLEYVDHDSLIRAFADAGHPAPEPPDEAYWLSVTDNGVHIRALTSAGLYYGMTTLWQLLDAAAAERGSLDAVSILDAPEFEWRGLMLDSARHMQSVAFIKRYLDWMSLHKLNVLHWHLTDDQAWRLEIRKYPRLTEVGGWRVPAGAAGDIDASTGQARRYGGWYTQESVREIVEHARLRHVTVVPEIDVPGHVTAAIAAYPELGVDGHGIDAVPSSWGIYDNVLNLEPATFRFLEDVFREVAELFPGPYVHVGGDEVVTRQWESSARIQERMRELGIADTQELQNHFVERLHGFLTGFGKSVIGWDEIIDSELPEDAVVMSWRGIDGAIAAAARGHRTVLSPAPTFYLDHIQSLAPDAPPGRGGLVTARDIYDFEPLPAALAGSRRFVLGLQGNLWTEHVRTEERVAYMSYPRAAAIAELGWSLPAARNWRDFSRRLSLHLPRLQQLGIAVAKAELADRPAQAVSRAGVVRLEDRELELCSQSIVLALEDDAPVDGERESYLLDIMDPCWIAREVDLREDLSIRAAVGQLPFNFEIGAMIADVVVAPPATPWGELNVRLGSCDGRLVAALSLEPAHASAAATVLPPAALALPQNALPSTASLCFRFARHGIDPIWAIDWIELAADFAEHPR